MEYSNDLGGSVLDDVRPVFATFGSRFGASLIDFLVMLPLTGASFYFAMMAPNFAGIAVVTLISLLYGPVMDSMAGGTVGKLALKQRVTTLEGGQISLGQGFMRALPWLIGGAIGLYTNYQTLNIPGIADADGFMDYSMRIAEYQQENGGALQQVLGQLVWILPLGSSLFVLGTEKKQAAHDILAETLVVKPNPMGSGAL